MSRKTKVKCLIGVSIVLFMIFAIYKYIEIRRTDEYFMNTYHKVLSRVHVGEKRDITIKAMQDAGAWYHGTCGYESGNYEDIYVFGPKNKQEAIVWDVFSEEEDGEVIVVNVGSISESMAVPEKCSPSEIR
jgi:hypothetical protein